MKSKKVKPTKIIEKKEIYEDGANVPDCITVHKCFCGKGCIEHHVTPGFDDNYFVICCEKCEQEYDYICEIGYEWEVFLAKTN